MNTFQFPSDTQAFLSGIAAHNDKAWFEENRPLYDTGYVAAGKAFVETLGPELARMMPGLNFAPRINGSMMRVNRDVRFSKDKRPYKDHLDLWFWHGDKKGWDRPGFWFRLTATQAMMGSGIFRFDTEQMESFRQSVIHPRSARALQSAISEVHAAGPYDIGEKTRKLPPRGYTADPEFAEYLLYEGLTAGITLPADVAYAEGFAEICLSHFAACLPIARWLLTEVVE